MIEWIDTGNSERRAVYGADQGGNYKSLRVRRMGWGHWRFEVNEIDRGYRATEAAAKQAAIAYAAASPRT
jgi:hypothetical protein